MILARPGNKKSTHHITLSDGSDTVGLIACNSVGDADVKAISRTPTVRTAMKTTTGNSKYSDYELPWVPIPQEDFSGGRGSDDYDKDVTRYYDGNRANAMFGKIIHGPQEQYMTGLRNAVNYLPGNVKWYPLLAGGDGHFIANKFTLTADLTTEDIYVLVRRIGTPKHQLTVALKEDSAGEPGSTIDELTLQVADIEESTSEWIKFNVGGYPLGSGFTYWIVAYCTTNAVYDIEHWEVAISDTRTNGLKGGDDPIVWIEAPGDLYYRVVDADANNFTRFFQYKRALYLVRSIASAASTLWINGDRGTADANTGALTTLVDATKSWTVNEWAGCYVVLSGGTGSNEDQTWRKILSNTTTTLTLDTAWEITHDTTTEYVILGSNKWTEITGTGIAAKVTDVLVVNNIIYFAQGDSTVIRAAKFETSAGTWTATYRDDTTATNKATLLQTVRDKTSGAIEIWRANNISPTSSKPAVSKAPTVAWGSDLVFATEIAFEDSFGKITGLEEYGDTDKYLWVFREGTIYAINTGKPDEIPLREIRTLMSESNGRVHTIHNAYMYVNLGGGLQQYYSRQLTDMGTNRDEGLPSDRNGVVSGLQGYPGRLYEAIDAGSSGYSQVHGWNLVGWHEMYRGAKGQRITSLGYEVIPDIGSDRMLISIGSDVIWIPFPSKTLDPTKDSSYRFTHECSLVSGWLYAGLLDVYKLYNSFKLFAEDLDEDVTWVEVDYQVDDDTEWTKIGTEFVTTPVQEETLSNNSIQGKRLRYRIRSYTSDATKTPTIKTTVVECISRVSVKFAYSMSYRLDENGTNLLGVNESQGTPKQLQDKIDNWANTLTRLTMRAVKEIYDDKKVFIDPSPLTPIGDDTEKYIAQINITEV